MVEREGTIRVVRDSGTAATPFLDVQGRVDQGDEGGLLSMAFSPDYAVSGRFYVFLTTGVEGDFDVEVWEYRVSADPDVADAATARRVIVVPHDDATNHVGGQLAFGPDGYLYVGIGDGGLQGDPLNRAQDPSLLLGKILRIDPRGRAPDAHVIPPGNAPGAAPEVWALGLRNPWRFSFDRVTGALLIGDVGFDSYEEVDLLPFGTAGGTNFGWRSYEGLHLARRPARARERRGADPRVPAHRSLRPLLDHGRLRRARSERARARRPLRLRRLLLRLAAQPEPDAPAASDDREEVAAEVGRSPVSFGEDGLCRVYVLSEGGPAARLASTAPGPATGCPASQVPPATLPPEPAPQGPAFGAEVRGTALQRLGVVLRSGLAARCAADVAATCVVTASVNAATGRALGMRSKRDRRTTPVYFARGTARVSAYGDVALRLRLTNVARRALAARRQPFRSAVRLWAVVTAGGGRTPAETTIVLQRRG